MEQQMAYDEYNRPYIVGKDYSDCYFHYEYKYCYELELMDLVRLQAVIKKDGNGLYYIEIGNAHFKNLKYQRSAFKDLLKLNLKQAMYYFLLEKNEIRYCTECEKTLILDERTFINICTECMKKEPQVKNEYERATLDFIHKENEINEAKYLKSVDDICKEAADEADVFSKHFAEREQALKEFQGFGE